MDFKPFDLVWKQCNSTIYVVVTNPIEIPYFEEGTGSDYSNAPLKLDNPEEWKQTFTGYIAFNTLKSRYEIISENHGFSLVKENLSSPISYIPFDQATGMNRIRLGLLNLSEELDKQYK